MNAFSRSTLMLIVCLLLCICFSPSTFADEGAFVIPANTTVIEDEAFAGCTWIKTITIPAGVTRIGDRAFYGCSRLSDVFYNGTAEQWEKIYIGNENTPLLNALIHYSDTTTMLTSGVWGDLEWAFYSNGLLSFSGTGSMNNVESSITPSWHSYKDQITEITINDGISSIGDRAFIDFAKLQSINIPQSVTSVGAYALNGCISLETIHLPDNLRVIGTNAFAYCHNLTSITIPNAVTSIGGAAFWDCENLTSIVIPEGITSLGNNMFYHCYALSAVTLPNSLRTISSGAFMYCVSLKEIIIPNQVKTIGDYSFADCNHLSSVSFSDQVESIGNGAFEGCLSLKHVYYNGTQTQWNAVTVGIDNDPLSSAEIHFNSELSNVIGSGVCGDDITWELDKTGLLTICGTGSMTDYSMQMFNDYSYYPAPWYDYHEMISIVEIEEGITNTGNYSFYNCNNLTSVSFPEGMLSIGEHAFRECKNLTYVSFPKSLQSIGYAAFYGCSSLITVNMSEEITSIGEAAFYNCGALSEMSLPKSLSNLGDQAFRNCSNLTNVAVPGNVTSIGNSAFYNCSRLTDVIIEEGTTSISDHAFRNCNNIARVTFPYSLTRVGSSAFYGCSKLNAVYYGGTQTQWGAISIGNYNTPLTGAKKYFNSDGTEANYSQTISGILQSGDGWQVKWEVLYNIVSGAKTDAFLKIYIEGVDTAETAIPLYCLYPDRENIFTMPWLTDFQKSDFEKIYIQGSIDNPFEIVSNQFSGYSNVETIQLSRVSLLQSGAFNDCTNLKTFIYDGWLTFIGNGAFKNDSNLNKLYNRSLINEFETISDEAFMYTGLTSFDFHSALRTIGDRAFMGSHLTSAEIGPDVTSIGKNAFDSSIVFYCYRDSEAQRYAEREGIAYELIDTYDDHLVFNGGIYKDANTLTEMQFGWSFELFGNDARIPNDELAIASLILSADIYNWDELESALAYLGFGNIVSGNYNYYNDINRVGYAIASTVQIINGIDTNIIAVVCRGSANGEDWRSNILQQAQGFRYAADDVLTGLEDYLVSQNIDSTLPIKLLITGHSRGAAVANILGTTTSGITSSDNIFVYTFACPNTTTEADRFYYDNICNILVEGDPVPWLPVMIDGDNKFGRTVTVKACIDDADFIKVFQSITGGVSTVAIDNDADCITSYPVALRHHTPAVYMASILEPNGTALGNDSLRTIINNGTTYLVSIISKNSVGGGGFGGR